MYSNGLRCLTGCFLFVLCSLYSQAFVLVTAIDAPENHRMMIKFVTSRTAFLAFTETKGKPLFDKVSLFFVPRKTL
jgi:hypothetical protein